jgi:hypothetical protein
MTAAEIIAASIGALELNDTASGVHDVMLEQSALAQGAPSAHPPYCDMKTAMITTCADESEL